MPSPLGASGIITPFIGIKLIDMLICSLAWRKEEKNAKEIKKSAIILGVMTAYANAYQRVIYTGGKRRLWRKSGGGL